MGNQGSTNNMNEYTPEQYKQYLEFVENQKRMNLYQQQQQPQNTNAPTINNSRSSNKPPIHRQTPVGTNNSTPIAKTPVNKQNNVVNTAYTQQVNNRSQIKVVNNNSGNKLIPDVQQKTQMPSIENNYQTYYQQRMFDNLTIGGKTMASGAIQTNPGGVDNVGANQHVMNITNTAVAGQHPSFVTRPEISLDMYQNRFIEDEKRREAEFLKEQEKRMNEEHMKFKKLQDERRKKFHNELSEIENMKYNPEEILGLSKGTKHSANDIKKAYKNLALKYHPDKGGSAEIFKILTKAYLYLLKQTDSESYIEKSFFDLKKDAKQSDDLDGDNNRPVYNINEDGFNIKNFNSVFDQNRLDNIEHDSGYGDWKDCDNPIKNKKKVSFTSIEKEIGSGQNAKIFNDKFNLDIFNKVFNELKDDEEEDDQQQKQITVYKEPEVLPIGNGLQYSDIDYRKVNDYSRDVNLNDKSNGLYYTDYKKAMTNTTLINPANVKTRQSFKDMDDIATAREKQDFTLTDEDRARIENQKRKDEEEEYNRQMRLRERDQQLAEHNARVNRLMLAS